MQIYQEVRKVIGKLIKDKKMFTVYDVTRILQDKFGTAVKHDNVRDWVRFNFSNGIFPDGWTNNTGDHLPYSPSPHIYAPPKANILKYDPNALLPEPKVTTKQVKASVIPARIINVVAVSVQSEYLYALVNKKTGERAYPSKGNSIGLYETRNGPSQLRQRYCKNDKNYEVVKYEIVLKPVGN